MANLNACVLTIVRDGDDYLEAVMDAVAPHVSSVRITIDSRSQDNTREVAKKLAGKYPNLTYKEYTVTQPLADLVNMRNDQMDFTEPWGFIVDSDEFHHMIGKYELGKADAYSLKCHAPWNEFQAHGASAKAVIGRFFRKHPTTIWQGRFGKEVLYSKRKPVFTKETTQMPYRYIHFTHLKKDKWREELNQRRVADGRLLYDLPKEITKIIQDIHAKKA